MAIQIAAIPCAVFGTDLTTTAASYTLAAASVTKFKVAVTAPTGIAATNVSGVTIHSWAGVGLAKGRPQTIIDKVLKSSVACARWRQAVVLVVDEVSMLDSELFDILEATGRAVRGGQRPFGGLQIVTCGDFYQLPPVKLGEYGKGFAFQVND